MNDNKESVDARFVELTVCMFAPSLRSMESLECKSLLSLVGSSRRLPMLLSSVSSPPEAARVDIVAESLRLIVPRAFFTPCDAEKTLLSFGANTAVLIVSRLRGEVRTTESLLFTVRMAEPEQLPTSTDAVRMRSFRNWSCSSFLFFLLLAAVFFLGFPSLPTSLSLSLSLFFALRSLPPFRFASPKEARDSRENGEDVSGLTRKDCVLLEGDEGGDR